MEKRVVAHFVANWGSSWIYNQLINIHGYQPILLTYKVENLSFCPFYPIYQYKNKLSHKSGRIYQFARRIKRTFLSTELKYFYKILRETQTVLLHSHFGNSGYNNLELKNISNIPMITSFYGFDISMLPSQPFWRRRYRKLFSIGERFLVLGNSMKDQLLNLGCPEEKILIHRLGVDLDAINFVPRKISSNEKIRILIACNFVEKKGIPYALKAFAKIRGKYANVELAIIGDGKLKSTIERFITELKISDCTKLLGYLPNPILLDKAKEYHLFLHPSITTKSGDKEGTPVVIMEMQASGMPVISTYHADIPEVVLDGISGFLVPERDVNNLAERIEYLVEHPEKWIQMGEMGRKHIDKNYNAKKLAEELEDTYSDLI